MATKRSPTTPLTPYGLWVCTKLLEHNMSRRTLAEQLGIKPQNLSRILHGATPGTVHRDRIEEILGERPPDHVREASQEGEKIETRKASNTFTKSNPGAIWI